MIPDPSAERTPARGGAQETPCAACSGKGWLTPDDAERGIQHGSELFNAGYEAGKRMAAPAPPAAPAQEWQELRAAAESFLNLSRFRGEDMREEATHRLRNALAATRDLLSSPPSDPPAPSEPPASIAPHAATTLQGWLVVRYIDARGCEVWRFDDEAKARLFHDKAQMQWSDCYLTRIVKQGAQHDAQSSPSPSGEVIARLEQLATKWDAQATDYPIYADDRAWARRERGQAVREGTASGPLPGEGAAMSEQATATKDETYQGRCEAIVSTLQMRACGRHAVLRYPAMGGGYMRLCAEHGMKHRPICERWNGQTWEPLTV
jgi:hypothetical protein